MNPARRSRNPIVLVVVLVLVIETGEIEDEDEDENEEEASIALQKRCPLTVAATRRQILLFSLPHPCPSVVA
jgi:hypothetical protein